MIRCLNCHAETSNGLALCDLCQRKALLDLEYLPIYFTNLARWRPGKAGARQVPGSREPFVQVYNADPVSRALDEVGNDMTTWARAFADDRPHAAKLLARLEAADLDEEAVMRWLCRGFEKMLVSVATLDWAGEFVRAIGEHEARLRELTERVAPGWYAGLCRRCTCDTHVVPGLTWVTCLNCGATTYARDHLDTVLDEARGWVARPMRLAETIVALVDGEMSVPRLHKRISKWGERGQVETLRKKDPDGDPSGPKRFRLGEVLDLLRSEGQTRHDDRSAIASRAAS